MFSKHTFGFDLFYYFKRKREKTRNTRCQILSILPRSKTIKKLFPESFSQFLSISLKSEFQKFMYPGKYFFFFIN
jgi:hypothetical protein